MLRPRGSAGSSGGRLDLIWGEWHESIRVAGLGFTDVCMDSNCLLVARDHPLALKGEAATSDLDGETVAVLENGADSMAEVVRSAVIANSPEASVVTVAEPSSALLGRVSMGECVLLATESMATDAYTGIASVPLKGTPPARMGFLHAADPSEPVRSFIGCFIRTRNASAGGL